MAPPIKRTDIKFDTFDIAVYRGYTIERIEKGRNRQGHQKAYWVFRILGRPGWFDDIDLVIDEINYLKVRRDPRNDWQRIS